MLLDGCRVFVVEDNFLVAAEIETMLQDDGCTVVGPFTDLSEAIAAARTSKIDVALLDVDVGGEPVFPLAAVLYERGVPFAFVTGGETGQVKVAFPSHPIIMKPFTVGDLRAFLTAT